jgi:hypothetical protein
MNRRDWLGLFGAGMLAVRPTVAQDQLPLPAFSALDHI